ncbi:MAG: hypothetical protein OEY01_01345 [Desulfobulbaceae bacterium]|nr:hypothetical protein [Desulfobulbaceae bacterium]HIJ77937.1 hypothetical protein [Deltaproteobacteria bacterium]
MTIWSSFIALKIPANKFFPPHFAASHNLFRSRLVNEILHEQGKDKKIFLIEAQGGHGKTTLATQYLDAFPGDYAWYQVGPEDSDPVLFFSALVVCLENSLPGFSCAPFEKMLANSKVNVGDLPGLANMMLAGLVKALDGDFFMVFDDLHLLEESEHTLSFLDYLIETSPPRIRFILLSRRPVKLKNRLVKFGIDILRLGNEDLALTARETDDLLNGVLALGVPMEVVRKIHQATEGWVMGMILAGHALEGDSRAESMAQVTDALAGGRALDYFKDEIFTQIPAQFHDSLLKLSLLDEISVDLAEEITGEPEIGEKLTFLMNSNYFVRSLDRRGKIFGFHHLFQEFMQERAKLRFSKAERAEILKKASVFSMGQKRVVAALRYALVAEDYDEIDSIIEREGMALLAVNQHASILSILQQVPPEILQQKGWMLLFTGLAYSDLFPEKCRIYLEGACGIFGPRQEKIGELLALSQLIMFLWVVAGTHKDGERLLPRAVQLFDEVGVMLPPFIKIIVAKNIASGFCYFNANMERSSQYSSLAMRLAQKYNATGLIANVLLIQGYENLLLGYRQKNKRELEWGYSILLDSHVAATYKMALCTMQIDDLQMHGDFVNYRQQKEKLISLVGQELLEQTIVGPYLVVWDCSVLIAEGRFAEAARLVEAGVHTGRVDHNPHMRSQFMQWLAYAAALLGYREKALVAINESALLREVAGGDLFLVQHKVVAGRVYYQLGHYQESVRELNSAIEGASSLVTEYWEAAALMVRAGVFVKLGQLAEAQEDIGRSLVLMKKNRFSYFIGITPALLQDVLEFAVKRDIETDYALLLGRERLGVAFDGKSKAFPLLEITFLGGFSVGIGGRRLLKTEDFTPAQKRVLALLVSSPNLRIDQEKVQFALWPEGPPDKTRSKFDTLLSRLRKTISEAIAPHSLKNYLTLKQGILCLDNCNIDARLFEAKANKGLLHARANEWWMAGNCFYEAVHLWQSCFAYDNICDDLVHCYCNDLRHLLAEASRKWGENLAEVGRMDEAIYALREALKSDFANAGLVKMLYLFLRRHGKLAEAQQIVRDYGQHLSRENYLPEEIKEMLDDIVSMSPN